MSSKKRSAKLLEGLRKYRVGSDSTYRAIEEYFSSLDCPRALTAWILFKENEHGQLAKLEFDPLHYNSLQEIRDSYAATKFLSKFKDLVLDSDLDEVAWLKFREFELLCKSTNDRFRNLSLDPKYKGRAVWLHHAVIRKIEKLLGDFDVDEFFSKPDWGPGASTLIKRRDASSAVKFQKETGITRDLYSLVPPEIMAMNYPLWSGHLVDEKAYPSFQVGNKVITVAKDATTNRVIAVEPGINLWFQKAVGEMVGSRLRRVGIDLRYQSRNQELSRIGSKDRSLATIDLSSASDSVSRSVVEALLPPRWFVFMDASRSHYGQFLGQTVRWEKFSSMGNGFTFQLESLIFYAIAKCCVEYMNTDVNTVSVYGDDVIIPTSTFELFSEMMAFYGFRINMKKSHVDSFFRESCGAHYYSGFDVKPIYFKGKLTTILTVYRLANAIRRLAHRRNGFTSCDAKFRNAFNHLVQSVPGALRLRVSEGLGDGGFVGNFDESHPTRAKDGIEGYRVLHLGEVAVCYEEDRVGYLLSELWRISEREKGSIPSRGRLSLLETLRLAEIKQITTLDAEIKGRNSVPLHRTKYRLTMSSVRQWCDLGPWV